MPSLRSLSTDLFLTPLTEQRFKLLLRIDSLVNEQSVHGIDRGLETFVSRECGQYFFERHFAQLQFASPSNYSIGIESTVIPECHLIPSQFDSAKEQW